MAKVRCDDEFFYDEPIRQDSIDEGIKVNFDDSIRPSTSTTENSTDFAGEHAYVNENIYENSSNEINEPNNKSWDVFNEYPLDDSNHGNKKFYNNAVKFIKILAYIFVFIIVLAGAIISKGSLLFMSSQIRTDNKTPYCQLPNSNPDKRYIAVSNPQEEAQWIWALFLTFITPEVFTFGRSIRIMFFKSIRSSTKTDLLIVSLFEILHTVGVALLLFVALPELNVVKGAMLTNCICFIPAIIAPFTRPKEERSMLTLILDILSIIAQASGFVIWPYFMSDELHHGTWAIPAGLFLTSFGWWENYVNDRSPISLIKYLGNLKKRLTTSRYFVYAIVPWLKGIVFFACMTGFVALANPDKQGWAKMPFLEYFMTLDSRLIEIDTVNVTIRYLADTNFDGQETPFQENAQSSSSATETIAAVANAALLTWTIQFLCTWTSYVVGKFACRICIQSFSFAFPINLTMPITVTLLVTFCGIKQNNVCFMKNMLPRYLFWVCPDETTPSIFNWEDMSWVWIIWLFSQTWITMHIWLPKCARLAPTEKLFVTPMYSGIFVDQSLAMNRQRFEGEDIKTRDLDLDIPTENDVSTYETITGNKAAAIRSTEYITNIIACATMWHETDEEMVQMFKSILRMDSDQCARRNAQKYFQVVDPDYYEFETQIFFDDAFEISDQEHNWDSVINRFVKSAISMIGLAAREVHECDVTIQPPEKIATPYGGRLVWTLPGKTKLIMHLKDKSKIRHRKRWSQVMYMYYLLGFRIMATDYTVSYKEHLAENTFILALDGDIDFQPDAVHLLVDLMKKNKNLGASCGRIHPIGSGMMVWYQKFEYAIGHWLQKATEHMIGCVLCSPGCFSLFRASAIMDDNVMKKYTFKPTEARHYVQYDQGEDRWLCTLLLQQGYRVEYSAASDAYTHAPEGFAEFYNQRRRWVPSTMANIIDLLSDSGRTVKVNNDISTLYIIYQGMLMVGTVLGPGTIFLMMVGAFTSAFNVPTSTAFYLNAIPLVIFMIMCVAAKPSSQVLCAQILTCFYALVMLAVLVGVFLQISYSGWGSPTTFLTLLLPVTMIIAALLHPLEMTCLFWGWLYWLIIPSMYMLLMIYSYTNMNNVSWGTREVVQKKTKKELEEEMKKQEEAKKNQTESFVLSFLGVKDKEEMQGGFTISCAYLCSFLCCTSPKPKEEKLQLVIIQSTLEKINTRLELLERSVDSTPFGRRRSRVKSMQLGIGIVVEEDEEQLTESENNDNDEDSNNNEQKPKITRDSLRNPLWIEDENLIGNQTSLPPKEISFWRGLIATYLYPLDEDKEEKARIIAELKELRNKVIFAFFMLNAIFIVVVLLLQLNKDTLYINWPLGATSNITWTDDTETIKIEMIYQHLQPIGFVFMVFFAVVIVIQFIGMLFHRFETLSHILASTRIECLSQGTAESAPSAIIQKNAVDMAKTLQKLRNDDSIDEGVSDNNDISDRMNQRRATVHNIERAKNRKRQTSLDQAFLKRFQKINESDGIPILNDIKQKNKRRETMQVILDRRRKSTAHFVAPHSAAGIRSSIQSSVYQDGHSRSSIVYPSMKNIMDARKSVQLTQDGGRRLSSLGESTF